MVPRACGAPAGSSAGAWEGGSTRGSGLRPTGPTASTSSPRTSLGQSQFHPRATLPGQASPLRLPLPHYTQAWPKGLAVGRRSRALQPQPRGTPPARPQPAGPLGGGGWTSERPTRIPQAPALNAASGCGPANVCPRPVRSPLEAAPQTGPAAVKEIPHPAQPCLGPAGTRPILHQPPAPGPLRLNPQPKEDLGPAAGCVCPGL